MKVQWFVSKLPCGDYTNFDRPRLSIDRKANLEEVCGNLTQGRDRLIREMIRAQDLDIKLLFLVEHSDSIRTLSDVRHWVNPRKALSQYALDGKELYRRMTALENKFGTTFHFCTKEQTASKIIEILGGNHGIRY